MTTEELFSIARKDPYASGSTARLRLAGGCMYYKDDASRYFPLFAHMGTFILTFARCDISSLGASSRTQNQIRYKLQGLHADWMRSLVTVTDPEGMDVQLEDIPALEVVYDFGHKNFALSKPTASTLKMFCMGIHPETAKRREEWLPEAALTVATRDGQIAYQHCFQPRFEEKLQRMAYGVIQRENSLKALANQIGQLKLQCDETANNCVHELERRATNHFAPDSYEEAGTPTPVLHVLDEKMEKFREACAKAKVKAYQFSQICKAPDSMIPNLADSGLQWDVPNGDANPDSHYNEVEFESRDLDFHESLPLFKVGTPRVQIIDRNPRSYSYYWVRRHFETYVEVLRQMNYFVSPLFGQSPQEWKYEDLAAPLFALGDNQNTGTTGG